MCDSEPNLTYSLEALSMILHWLYARHEPDATRLIGSVLPFYTYLHTIHQRDARAVQLEAANDIHPIYLHALKKDLN